MTASQKLFYLAQQRYARYMWALEPLFWLPMNNRTGDVARNHAYIAAPGAELLDNWDFSAWTADIPDGWGTLNESGSDPDITEVGSGQGNGGGGSGSANMYNTTGTTLFLGHSAAPYTVGDTIRIVAGVSYNNSNVPVYGSDGAGAANLVIPAGETGLFTVDFIPNNAGWQLFHALGNVDVTYDFLSAVKISELDGLIGGTTSLMQTGKLGVGEAILFDGATSLLTVTNRASIQGLDEFSLWMLFNPASAGEGDAGILFGKSGEFELRFNSASRDLTATVNYDTTNATATTTTALNTNTWQSVGLRIDDSSKQIDIFINGVEASYASRTSGAGSRVSNTNDLMIGNNAGVTQTLDGLLDEAMMIGRALAASEWLQLHQLAGLD